MTDATASPDSLTSVTRAQGVPVIGCWADAPLRPRPASPGVSSTLSSRRSRPCDEISTPAKSKLEKHQSGTVRREQWAAKAFPLPAVSYCYLSAAPVTFICTKAAEMQSWFTLHNRTEGYSRRLSDERVWKTATSNFSLGQTNNFNER